MTLEKYRAYSLANYRKIPQVESLSASDKEAVDIVGRVLPFKTNSYVVNELIDWDNISTDPMFTLTFPRKGMLRKEHYQKVLSLLNKGGDDAVMRSEVSKIRSGLNPNPAGQKDNLPKLGDTVLEGIQHKYKETVLFFPNQGQNCHAYCSFCFRWTQFGGDSDLKFALKEADLLHRYLDSKKEVTDVLITGGDPLIMSTRLLAFYIEPLLEKRFDHIRTIRIGTKSLAYWPYRFLTDKDADALLVLFEKIVKSGKNLAIQAHFNHPVELSTKAVKKAIKRILASGAQIRTQSPLLRNINDDPKLWIEMWRKQVDLNLIPYYMFVARDTGAKSFFELPLERCWEIFREAYSNVSGICRTVRGPSMSTNFGKIEVAGVTEINDEKLFVLKFLQGRKLDWVGKPFFAKYDPDVTWLDQLEPAFNEEHFFFEEAEKEQYQQIELVS